ncbi:MAG TPA: hypothetical protein VGP99_07875 [Tepidisphaeraceae bacterium]|jgi:hypothetical protein|nr:hypothetical protein [Tepidisphaeraceae bacterium]
MIPNADRAIVEREKIVEYLLNPAHPDNGGKAEFFLACGFSVSPWEQMAESLRRVLRSGGVLRSVQSVDGEKYVVDGELDTPAGNVAIVRSVWIVGRA